VNTISKNKDFMMNEDIREKEVRVINWDGEALGVIPTKEALKLAEEKELDLVAISPNANPPVCKIMDFGKYIYEQQRKDKEAKKKQKVVNIKEIRMGATTEEHDIEIKANNAKRFLLDGDKVKVTVRFKGRQIENSQVGYTLLNLFVEKLGDVYVMEKPARQEGRNMIMILAPKRA
jgi:translation initiation factor IF-3